MLGRTGNDPRCHLNPNEKSYVSDQGMKLAVLNIFRFT